MKLQALLEPSIWSLDTNTDDKTLAQLYYRVGRIYKETADYKISTKCHKCAFNLMPNHESIIFSVWSNYRIQGKFSKAQSLVAKVQQVNIKYLMEMLTNPYEITYKSEKFISIKLDNLSSFCKIHYDGCEYMACYNKIPNKQLITKKQQLKLTEKFNV